jgi:hypothetical protein
LKQKKETARWKRIEKVYGLTRSQYNELDDGSCPVCLRNWSDSVRPVIDHDHHTGFVRGLLCRYCNHRVVGRNRDASKLQRVVDYLLRSVKYKVPPKVKKKKIVKNISNRT